GDRIQLQQVLLNLIMNGIEAMSGDGEASHELSITSTSTEVDGIVIAVTDSGPGLDPATRDRLFEAFHTTKPQGMGMGLAIGRSWKPTAGGCRRPPTSRAAPSSSSRYRSTASQTSCTLAKVRARQGRR